MLKDRVIIFKVFELILKATPISGILTIITSIVIAFVPAITTYAMAHFFDEVSNYLQGGSLQGNIFYFGLVYLLTMLLDFCLMTIISIITNYGVFEKNLHLLKLKIGEKYADLPLIYFENAEFHNVGERACFCVRKDYLPRLFLRILNIMTALVSIISVSTILAMYSIWFLPLCVLSGIPYLIARIIRGSKFYALKRHQARKNRRLSYLWGLFNKGQTIKEMRTMGSEEYITEQWLSTRDEVNEELWQFSIKDSMSLLLCDFLKTLGYLISIAFAFSLVVSGSISVGLFGASILSIKTVQEKIKNFMVDFGSIPELIGFARDFFEFMNLPNETNGMVEKSSIEHMIQVKNASFKYPNSEYSAIKNLNLIIQKGEKVVILGENGSGKTTLSKMILGLYEPTTGSIVYDGVSFRDIDKNIFYQRISSIAQDFGRYKLTLRENVALSDTINIQDDVKVRDTLVLVGLEELSKSNFNDQIGREFGGLEYSGGQWQKIAIARALFKYSELVILDEPTSSLDPIIETEILRDFIKICKDKTAIIISHRVGLCRLADKIIVMKNGEIAEIGSHNELMTKNGEYTKLFISQAKWY